MADFVRPLSAAARNNLTFAYVADDYLAHGGEARYLPPIVEWIGDRQVSEIAPFDVREMAMGLYPHAHQSNSTRNRAVITPTRAVMYHGYDRGWAPLIRIRNLKVERAARRVPASAVWMFAFLRQCELDGANRLAALALMMHQTGARISEAMALRWPQVDLVKRRVLLLKTKTTTNSVRYLTDELVARIGALPCIPDEPVFGYRNRKSVNERIRTICERAGISYKSSHVVGRHSFATNAINAGVAIPVAMEAGAWRSVKVFVETYVHTTDASRSVADQFNTMRFDARV